METEVGKVETNEPGIVGCYQLGIVRIGFCATVDP